MKILLMPVCIHLATIEALSGCASGQRQQSKHKTPFRACWLIYLQLIGAIT